MLAAQMQGGGLISFLPTGARLVTLIVCSARRREGANWADRQLISPLLPRCDVDAFIRLGLLKEDQRQDEEALRTAVMTLVYRATTSRDV